MSGMPFTPSVEQTAIAIAYRNKSLIADAVCPRVTVGKKNFKYTIFDKADRMTIPDTRIGRKSAPNQVEFSSSEDNAACEDYGLSDVVPQDDIDNAPAHYDPLNHATESISDIILLAREVRVANMYSNADNFGATYKLGSGALKHLDDPNLDVLVYLQEMLDDMFMTANTMTMSRKVATKLRSNKHVIKAYNGSLGDSGLVPLKFITDTLEIEHVNIGAAFVNTAKKGKTPTYSRAWQDNLALTYVDPLASTQNSRMTFAMTAQYGTRVSSRRSVQAGLHGGTEVMVGESLCELAIAKECGILLTDTIGYTP